MMGRIYKTKCKNCNKEYIGRGKFFCSKSCKTSYSNKTNNPAKRQDVKEKIRLSRFGKPTISRESHWNWKGKKDIVLYCQDCKKRIKSIPYGKKANIKYCQICTKKGDRSHRWKGGTTPQRLKEYKCQEYKNFVNNVLKRDDYTCQYCGIKNGCGKNVDLQIHHIKSYAEYPNLRFDITNGITLCKECHNNTKRNKKRPDRIDKIFIKKICNKCGKEFSKRNPRKFCDDCKITICFYCNNKFRLMGGKSFQKFCSRKCYGQWFSENKRGENNPHWKEKIKKICKNCNKKYFIKPSIKETSKFCSLKCKSQWQSIMMSKNNARWRK